MIKMCFYTHAAILFGGAEPSGNFVEGLIRNICVKLLCILGKQFRRRCRFRGESRIYGKEVHMYKCVGCSFC